MVVSFIQLLFPVNIIMEWYFTAQTKRKSSEIGINFFNELCLFLIVIWILKDWYEMNGLFNDEIPFARTEMTGNQLFTCNILWHQYRATYPFEYFLAAAALNTWLKFLLKLRVTKQFGPMFKTLQNMTIDLIQFMIIWLVVLIMFTCVSILIFGQLDSFQNFIDILVMYFEASLGNWNMNVYSGTDFDGNPLTTLYNIGVAYQSLLLLINMVLFLNFVIAILSSTFAYYENKQLGLYYEVIVSLFPSMDYDDKYGAVVCAQPPFNLLILPFQWITVFPLNDNFLRQYNTFLCHLLYFPIGLVITIFFTVINTVQMPLAYLVHTLTLIQTLTDSDETMDELSEKVQRAITIVKFIIFGPLFLLVALPVNSFVFFRNLYTRPIDADVKVNQKLVSRETLELFSIVCDETLSQTRAKGDRKTVYVSFVELNKNLQLKLDIQAQIRALVFDNSDENKFQYDPISKK